MKDLAQVDRLIKSLEARVKQFKVKRVNKVKFKLGQLSQVSETNLKEAFLEAAKGTVVEGAEVSIEAVDVKLRCAECNESWTIPGGGYTCPKCRRENVEIVTGEEFFIDEISVE